VELIWGPVGEDEQRFTAFKQQKGGGRCVIRATVTGHGCASEQGGVPENPLSVRRKGKEKKNLNSRVALGEGEEPIIGARYREEKLGEDFPRRPTQ